MPEVQSLETYYNRGKPNEFHALKGATFSVRDGEAVAIMGKSGAVKGKDAADRDA